MENCIGGGPSRYEAPPNHSFCIPPMTFQSACRPSCLFVGSCIALLQRNTQALACPDEHADTDLRRSQSRVWNPTQQKIFRTYAKSFSETRPRPAWLEPLRQALAESAALRRLFRLPVPITPALILFQIKLTKSPRTIPLQICNRVDQRRACRNSWRLSAAAGLRRHRYFR